MALRRKKNTEPTTPKVSKKMLAEMSKPFSPTLPGVNLLSAEVLAVVEQQRLKRLFIGLTVAAVAAVGSGYGVQAGLIASAENDLAEATATQQTLAAEKAALAPVAAFYAQIDANRATIQQTMANEVLASQVLKELDRVTPRSVRLTTTGMTLASSATGVGAATPVDPADATGGVCPSQDPYVAGGASAGCITVDGTARSRAALSGWLNQLAKADMFTVAFIPNSTADSEHDAVTFSATIGLNGESAYQNRYADLDFLLGGTN